MTAELKRLLDLGSGILDALNYPLPPRIRLLVVDDSLSDPMLLSRLLSKSKWVTFDIETARSIPAAMEIASNHPHDLFLLDWHIGPDTATDFIRQAKERGINGPFCIWTGGETDRIEDELNNDHTFIIPKRAKDVRLLTQLFRQAVRDFRLMRDGPEFRAAMERMR